MSLIDLDLNNFSGGPNWLSAKGMQQTRRHKHRLAWEAKHPRKPNPVRPETQARLERVVERAKKVELARYVKLWQDAIKILDKSEVPLRDLIERELAGVAGLKGVKYVAAMRAVDRLMVKVKRIRHKAMKQAFRHLRSKL